MRRDTFLTDDLVAVRSVLLEVTEILSDFRECIVVTGGVTPLLLLPTEEPDSNGPPSFYRSTNDVDLVLDLAQLQYLDDTSQTIHDILFEHLYQQDEHRPYRYHRGVWISRSSRTIQVPVDLLAGSRYRTPDQAIHARVRQVHEVYASPLYGVDLALLHSETCRVSGNLPDGTPRENVSLRVVDLALFVVIKAIALADRLGAHQTRTEENHEDEAAKHAFDIHECLRRFPGGLDALAARLAPFRSNLLVQDGLTKLRSAFSAADSAGPRLLVREEKYAFEPNVVREMARQDAYQRAKHLFALLDQTAD
jgi:hypothetical protein